jgi:hypothetical protein
MNSRQNRLYKESYVMKKNVFLFAVLVALLTFVFWTPEAFAAPAEKLTIQRLVFSDEIQGLGQYTPRPNARFTLDDVCTVYVEVAGFAMPLRPDTQDQYDVNLAVDLALRLPQSKRIAASGSDLATVASTVRSPWSAYFLPFSFSVNSLTPGNFVLEVGVRDNISGQIVSQDLTLQVVEPTEADTKARLEREAAAQNQSGQQ